MKTDGKHLSSIHTSCYKVLIIGGGKIGAFYDKPDSAEVLSHAHAFSQHPRFELHGIVEPDSIQADAVADRWNCTVFGKLDDAWNEKVDIAVVAVPDPLHYPILKSIATKNIRLVVAEKPLTKTLDESEDILSIYRKNKIPILVNYTRRLVEEFSSLRDQVRSGQFGRFLRGTGYYGKGILHNGSHMIDLLHFLFDEVRPGPVIDCFCDFFNDDPTLSAVLFIGHGASPFVLLGIDCRSYSIFEADLFFEKKRIRILRSGQILESHSIEESAVFMDYRFPEKQYETTTSLLTAMSRLPQLIVSYLDRGVPLPSTAETALMTQKICHELTELR